MTSSTDAPSDGDEVIDLRESESPGKRGAGTDRAILLTRLALLLDVGEPPHALERMPTRDLARDVWLARYQAALSRIEMRTDRQIALYECLVAAVDGNIRFPPAESATSARLEAWTRVVDALQRVHRPGGYIGTFRVALGTAVEHGASLPASDRDVLALLLVHVAAVSATLVSDFHHAVDVAQRIGPTAVRPDTAVDAVLRLCLRVPDPNPLTLAAGLVATLRLLGSAGKPVLDHDATWAIREALALVPMTDEIDHAILGLNPADRDRVERLVDPVRRPWWTQRLLRT